MPEKINSRKKKQTSDNSQKTLIKKVAVSSAIGLILFFALMGVFSIIASKNELSDTLITIMPYFSLAVSGFASGFKIAGAAKEKAFLYCLLTCLIQMVIICAVMLLSVKTIGLKTAAGFATMIVFSLLGAYSAKSRKPKRKI